jgi:hypothetical protein
MRWIGAIPRHTCDFSKTSKHATLWEIYFCPEQLLTTTQDQEIAHHLLSHQALLAMIKASFLTSSSIIYSQIMQPRISQVGE